MDIIEIAKQRYTAKHYDSSKKISPENAAKLKELLRLAPSSVNSQPWHFLIASTAAGKARIAKSTCENYDFNTAKIMDAALAVVFCARTEISDAYLRHITEKQREDGRFGGSREIEADSHKGLVYFAETLRKKNHDLACWTARQTYLNIGAFLLGAAALGIDTTPMEGFDPDILNREFGLPEKGLNALCIVTAGYHAADDANASRPKSRLAESEIITEF